MHEFLQTTVNGLSSGSIYALAAIGLTLVYGILKLVNFAHGDFMTLGAYVAFAVNVSAGMHLALAIAAALAAVAATGLAFEFAVWRPMRRRGAGMLQLLLMSLGLAFVVRYMIQLEWTGASQKLHVDPFQAWHPFDLTISRIQVIVMATAGVLLTLVAVLLKTTTLGKSMRALSDNFDLAEVSGIDTGRVISVTWLLAGGLAGLAGVFAAIHQTTFDPDTGFRLLLSVFAAVILGGIGSAYGALAGGLLLGLVQEWSTIGGVIQPSYKDAVGFLILIVVLLVRPQGIFGRATRAA
ncbi:MAG: branched-chain amino acid ABC transporter permease [Actinomycetota bacterium]